jgi:hypothetical protein
VPELSLLILVVTDLNSMLECSMTMESISDTAADFEAAVQ